MKKIIVISAFVLLCAAMVFLFTVTEIGRLTTCCR